MLTDIIAVVDYVNKEKKSFHYVYNNGNSSDFASFEKAGLVPSEGMILEIKCKEVAVHDGAIRYLPQSFSISENRTCHFLDSRSGRLEVSFRNGEPSFGFLLDYYVHANILRKYGIKESCDCKIRMIRDPKSKSGWRVFAIENIRGLITEETRENFRKAQHNKENSHSHAFSGTARDYSGQIVTRFDRYYENRFDYKPSSISERKQRGDKKR